MQKLLNQFKIVLLKYVRCTLYSDSFEFRNNNKECAQCDYVCMAYTWFLPWEGIYSDDHLSLLCVVSTNSLTKMLFTPTNFQRFKISLTLKMRWIKYHRTTPQPFSC